MTLITKGMGAMIKKFGGEQIGRRRRDDYTDGEPRIPVPSQTP